MYRYSLYLVPFEYALITIRGNFSFSQGFSRVCLFVYADAHSYAAMMAATPLSGSTEEWSTEILCEAGLLASKRSDIPFQYADHMTGGMV